MTVMFGVDDHDKLLLSYIGCDADSFLNYFHDAINNKPIYNVLFDKYLFIKFAKYLIKDFYNDMPYSSSNWSYQIFKKDDNYDLETTIKTYQILINPGELETTLKRYRYCDVQFIFKNKQWYKVDEEFRLIPCTGEYANLHGVL